jgi:hypothetical protein
MSKLSLAGGSLLGAAWLLVAACSDAAAPSSPSPIAVDRSTALSADEASVHGMHAAPPAEDNGYIKGWFEGDEVQLYYTKSYACGAPPTSQAPTGCEIGASPGAPPRSGPIPTIYAIAAVGFTPDPSTVACLAGSPCLNHPGMIDLSRIGGPPSALPVSHSHVLAAHHAGWHNTVNIRVFSLSAWNQIAAAKTLDKVRELQGNPATGIPGVISGDTPTNIYFFIASWRTRD